MRTLILTFGLKRLEKVLTLILLAIQRQQFLMMIQKLINIKESTKVLSTIESRALIYQGILITTDIENKLLLINALKNSFKNEGMENAFDVELRTLHMKQEIQG